MDWQTVDDTTYKMQAQLMVPNGVIETNESRLVRD